MKVCSCVTIALVAVAVLAGCSGAESAVSPGMSHYAVTAALEPSRQFVAAEVELTLIPPDATTELVFFLHRQFVIDSVTAPDLISSYFDTTAPGPFMAAAGSLHLRFSSPLPVSEPFRLLFSYHGRITDWPGYLANVITPEWTELGMYLPWFPRNERLTGLFSFSIDVTCEPGYVLSGFGEPVQNGEFRRFAWPYPTNDMVITAAPEFHTANAAAPGCAVAFHYSDVPDTLAQTIADDLAIGLGYFRDWWGDDIPPSVTLIQSLRTKGGGYGRRGLIVLAGIDAESYFSRRAGWLRYLWHEAAHIWWWRAPSDSWHDWLNESLAEYSALLALREHFGDETCSRRVESKRQDLQGSPPIWEMERSRPADEAHAQQVETNLYNKGPVLLAELEERVGREQFRLVCRQMVTNRATSTQDFLTTLAAVADPETAAWFEEQLRVR